LPPLTSMFRRNASNGIPRRRSCPASPDGGEAAQLRLRRSREGEKRLPSFARWWRSCPASPTEIAGGRKARVFPFPFAPVPLTLPEGEHFHRSTVHDAFPPAVVVARRCGPRASALPRPRCRQGRPAHRLLPGGARRECHPARLGVRRLR